MNRERRTALEIQSFKGKKKIVVLTAYDFPTAAILDRCGVDAILVGDSLGNVVLGYENTLPVTIEEMIHHAKAVVRARPRALVVVDMPFGTFQVGVERAVGAAIRIVKQTGADAIKLEGGKRSAPAVAAIRAAGIPVMGHVGLTPQSVLAFGGYKVQGRGGAGEAVREDARVLADAGCFSIVLESIPVALAERITSEIPIPTIGIGAGLACDGQVLVLHDMLGLFEGFRPKFVKRYADLSKSIEDAVLRYKADVESGSFPGPEHSFGKGES